jgi:Fe-S cluster biosynthesis and repair protein YggX
MGCGGGPPAAARIEPAGRKVFCVKFQKEMRGLSEVPFEGHPLGQKVYENVSEEGWSMWLEHMKMLMNEYRLDWPPFLRQTVKTQNSSNGEFELCLEGSSHRSLSWPPCGG